MMPELLKMHQQPRFQGESREAMTQSQLWLEAMSPFGQERKEIAIGSYLIVSISATGEAIVALGSTDGKKEDWFTSPQAREIVIRIEETTTPLRHPKTATKPTTAALAQLALQLGGTELQQANIERFKQIMRKVNEGMFEQKTFQAIRESLELSRSQMAKHLHLSVQSIYRWEMLEENAPLPARKNLRCLARQLAVPQNEVDLKIRSRKRTKLSDKPDS